MSFLSLLSGIFFEYPHALVGETWCVCEGECVRDCVCESACVWVWNYLWDFLWGDGLLWGNHLPRGDPANTLSWPHKQSCLRVIVRLFVGCRWSLQRRPSPRRWVWECMWGMETPQTISLSHACTIVCGVSSRAFFFSFQICVCECVCV